MSDNSKSTPSESHPSKDVTIPVAIPDVATEPHPTGPLDIPGLELPVKQPTAKPDDDQADPKADDSGNRQRE